MKAAWAVAFLVSVISSSRAEDLSLDQYISQVRTQGQSVQASEMMSAGAKERFSEGSILMAPTLFLNAEATRDEAPTPVPAFQGVLTSKQSISFGISKMFDIGLSAKVGYDLLHQDTQGAPILALPNYYTARPRIELSQSLWKNFGGSEINAQRKMAESQALANHYQESYNAKLAVLEAESSYWALVFARETLEIQKSLTDRAERLYAWSKRRYDLSLADRSDFLQASALLELRKLELESAKSDERSARIAFNKARRVEGDQVPEKLSAPESTFFEKAEISSRAPMRDDVLAAQQQTVATEASHDLAIQRNRPTLDLYGSYAMTGLQSQFSDAVSQGFDPDKATVTVGVRFSAPLAVGSLRSALGGRQKEKSAVELQFQKRAFTQEQEWIDLNRKLSDLRERYKLALAIEKTQKSKADYEKDRLNRGRSTTMQVIQFENDYSQAFLSKMRIQQEFLRTYSQLKLFGGPSS